jgi:Rha family phage regulatory protein
MDDFGVTEHQGIPVVNSRSVAETFNKRHDNVLRDIQLLTDSLLKIGEPNWQDNFILSSYKDRGKKYPEYLMPRDGFTLLAMGFTGKKAIQFKVGYIDSFNRMESFIKNLHEAKADFPEFTEAIMLTHEEPKHYHFSNELDMINRIVLGISTRQFKEMHQLEKVSSIRPYLSAEQIEAVRNLQRVDIGLIMAIPDFQERKHVLTGYHQRRLLKAIA